MYIKLKRNDTRNSEYSFCVYVCVGGERGEGQGTGEVIHLFQTVYVCWGWGGGGGDGEGDSLISNCIENSSQ